MKSEELNYDPLLIADMLDQFADLLDAGEADGAGRYRPAAIREQADALEASVGQNAGTVRRPASLPAPGEAVAWMFDYCGQRHVWLHKPSDENTSTVFKNLTPLYATAPPQVAKHGDIEDGYVYVMCKVKVSPGFSNWLFVQHADGQWVSAAKLEPRTISIIENQLRYGETR